MKTITITDIYNNLFITKLKNISYLGKEYVDEKDIHEYRYFVYVLEARCIEVSVDTFNTILTYYKKEKK